VRPAAFFYVAVTETDGHIIGKLCDLKAFQFAVTAMRRDQFFGLIHWVKKNASELYQRLSEFYWCDLSSKYCADNERAAECGGDDKAYSEAVCDT
jgi:hypothetical protein